MDTSIVYICAGATRGEERLNLTEKNNEIVKEIIDNVLTTNFHGIFLVRLILLI